VTGFSTTLIRRTPVIISLLLSAPLFMKGATAPSQSQITEFWHSVREQLSAQPMDAVVEPVTEPLPYRKHRLTLRGLYGVRFRAYMSVPVRGEAAPALSP
jgi:hypothetical protein